jgi:hypothetical protein
VTSNVESVASAQDFKALESGKREKVRPSAVIRPGPEDLLENYSDG